MCIAIHLVSSRPVITIKDIARSAGVSHTTVSRALRGDARIPPDTTERIVQLADEMGYVPNSIAQSLSSQRTFTIGMLVTSVADPVVMDFVEGAENIAQERGYSIFISTSRNDPQRELSVVENFQRRRVDGVVVVASRTGSEYSLALDRIQVPLVLLDSEEIGDKHPSVNVDNIGGAAFAVEHLLALGHRRIGYIGAPDRPLTNIKRLRGYTQTLEQAQVAIEPAWVSNFDIADDIQRGRLGLEQCLAAGVTAIFCYNDQIAIGVLNTCYGKGISVPRELSVVGFDDIRAASYVTPPLTTVRQPLQEMGRRAMIMLLDLIDDNPVQNENLECELILRSSVAPLAG
ncbi:MAG: LacI family DNA-binding transcriptional regulator [Caldilineaceae bacterium]